MIKKIIYALLLLAFSNSKLLAQKVFSRPVFEQAKTYTIEVDVQNTIMQQAMGQSIEFKTKATANHSYKATNVTDDFATLHHEMQKVAFQFEGMGSKRNFDSDKDKSGIGAEPVKELLTRKYNLILDSTGKVSMVAPATFPELTVDDRSAIIINMLKEIIATSLPPTKGGNSFFKILPDAGAAPGESWKDTVQTQNGVTINTYTLSAITDSSIVIDVKATGSEVIKTQMMGMEAITKTTNKTTGTIYIDKVSGIPKEQTITTEGTGTMEAMNTSMPFSNKTTMRTIVK